MRRLNPLGGATLVDMWTTLRLAHIPTRRTEPEKADI